MCQPFPAARRFTRNCIPRRRRARRAKASTRQAILGILARIPALAVVPTATMALPALPGLADAAALPLAADPIYAAMEVHRAAVAAWDAIYDARKETMKREGRVRPTMEEVGAALAAGDVEESTREDLLDVPPQSFESLPASLEHFNQTRTPGPHASTLLRSPIFAA